MKPGLADLPNIVIVPHIASASMWTRSGMVRGSPWGRGEGAFLGGGKWGVVRGGVGGDGGGRVPVGVCWPCLHRLSCSSTSKAAAC